MPHNESDFKSWIGNTETRYSTLTRYPMDALAATLDRSGPANKQGDLIPSLWHWLYFLDTAPQASLAADGHVEKGRFLPAIRLPRRMWAGSRVQFVQPLRIGEQAERKSVIKDIQCKQGTSGELAFVTVEHTISGPSGIALLEQQDIVYREPAKPQTGPPAVKPAPDTADFSKTLVADPVLLFRYSALTFNAHRIHYDRDFARSSEGYPGLVVHGPLLATLMLELLSCSLPGILLSEFRFRAMHPIFDREPFTVCCNQPDSTAAVQLWVMNQAGGLCMQGAAQVKEI